MISTELAFAGEYRSWRLRVTIKRLVGEDSREPDQDSEAMEVLLWSGRTQQGLLQWKPLDRDVELVVPGLVDMYVDTERKRKYP